MQMVALERLVGGQQSQRDRQIESRALLAGIGGSEIYGKTPMGKIVAGVLDRRLDPVQRFTRGPFGQADGPETREAVGDIDFDFDRERVDPGKRA